MASKVVVNAAAKFLKSLGLDVGPIASDGPKSVIGLLTSKACADFLGRFTSDTFAAGNYRFTVDHSIDQKRGHRVIRVETGINVYANDSAMLLGTITLKTYGPRSTAAKVTIEAA